MDTSMDFCIDCNSKIKSKERLMVQYSNALGKVVPLTPEPPLGHKPQQDYGLQYIGPECAKKYPRSWILTHPRREVRDE